VRSTQNFGRFGGEVGVQQRIDQFPAAPLEGIVESGPRDDTTVAVPERFELQPADVDDDGLRHAVGL
jgi:hypothetical protein